MIENLYIIGLNDSNIEELISNIGYDNTLNLACNYEIVKSNIDLLKSFGITPIEELLLNRSFIFLDDPEDNTKKFAKFNISVLVDLINNDYTTIDEVFDYN